MEEPIIRSYTEGRLVLRAYAVLAAHQKNHATIFGSPNELRTLLKEMVKGVYEKCVSIGHDRERFLMGCADELSFLTMTLSRYQDITPFSGD